MDCRKARELILTDYADDRMEGGPLKDLEAHLDSCDQCRVFLSEAKEVSLTFRGAGQLTPPPMVWERIRAAVAERPVILAPGSNILAPIHSLFLKARPVLAFATVAVLLLAVLITTRVVSNMGAIRQADEIFSMVDLGDGASGVDYDLGTPAESYFL